ncbi:2-deoxy-5-keto-D-gluconate 6-phosphate aldolase domain-containing protein, partial [Klebsiella pneumoniae]
HRHPRPDQDPELSHLHRVSRARPQWPALCVLAYDHRSQFDDLAREAGAAPARLRPLKRLINEVVAQVERDPGNAGRMG